MELPWIFPSSRNSCTCLLLALLLAAEEVCQNCKNSSYLFSGSRLYLCTQFPIRNPSKLPLQPSRNNCHSWTSHQRPVGWHCVSWNRMLHCRWNGYCRKNPFPNWKFLFCRKQLIPSLQQWYSRRKTLQMLLPPFPNLFESENTASTELY